MAENEVDMQSEHADIESLASMQAIVVAESPLTARATCMTKFSVAPVENDHAKHRRSATQKDQPVSFARLAGTSLQRQLQERGLQEDLQRQEATIVAGTISKHGLSMVERMQTYRRPLQAPMLHRCDWIQDQRARWPSFDCVTKEAWAAWKQEWLALPMDKRHIYNVQATAGANLAGTAALTDVIQVPLFIYAYLYDIITYIYV